MLEYENLFGESSLAINQTTFIVSPMIVKIEVT